jgi:glycosyltransferase involved in cell wall biosynthesis
MEKILFVSDKFPPHIGGMETHAYEFVDFFRGREGYDVDALSFTLDDTPDSLGVPSELIMKSAKENGIHHILPYESIFKPDTFQDWLRDHPADILFFNSLYWVRIWEALRDNTPSMKLLMRSGGNDIQQAKIVGKGDTIAERRSYVREAVNNNLDHLVITTRYVRERFSEIGISPEIMEPFVGGVDTHRFKPVSDEEKMKLRRKHDLPTDGSIVLCSARFIPFKGIFFALEATKKVIKENEEPVYFLLVGGGPLDAQIKQYIKECNLTERVILKKFIPVNKIQELYGASDLYLQLSTIIEQQEDGGSFMATEQMGRTYIEAQACGLPIVASRVGGIPEVVEHEKAGLLVKDQDSLGAAHSILRLLRDESLCRRLGAEGRRRAEEEFSWEVLFEAYERRLF